MRIWIRRGCCELDPVYFPIEICWLVGQLDQVQKYILEQLPFHQHLSYYAVLHYWIMYFTFFLCWIPRKTFKNTNWDISDYIIWNGTENFGIYNPNHPKLWTSHQWFERFLVCFMLFLVCLDMVNVSLIIVTIYDRFRDINNIPCFNIFIPSSLLIHSDILFLIY
jgi:hypothetical protein